MPKRGAPLTPFLASVMLGCSLGFVAASFVPLWKIVRLTLGFAGVNRGNFWDFLGELPLALECKATPHSFTNARSALSAGCLWENVRTTVLVVASGACLGCAAWWLQHAPAVWSTRSGLKRHPGFAPKWWFETKCSGMKRNCGR
jgi:hypothetical protein